MNVVIINHSDTAGGAAVVSLRLVHALRQEGVDARMLVVDRQGIDVYAQPMGDALGNKKNFLLERLGIYLHNGFDRSTLFQVDTCTHGVDASQHPWVREADVVVLAWVNQGTLSLKGIERIHKLGKPIVWVMHDMWNATGVCHHAYDCRKYQHTCQACPLLGSKGRDLSTRTQRRKAALYSRVPIHFVAVSHWLEDTCRHSSLMAHSQVSVIPNAFPVSDFDYHRLPCDGYLDLPAGRSVVIMGARRLDEGVKGFDQLIAATQHIASHKPALASRLHLLLYGGIARKELLEQLALPYTYVGTVASRDMLSQLYRHSDIVLSTSLYETLPGTLIEGQASGCIPVTYGKGGQADIVDHLKSGYIAAYKSPQSLAQGLEWAAGQPVSREALHREVERKFAAQAVARQYIDLFERLLHSKQQELHSSTI